MCTCVVVCAAHVYLSMPLHRKKNNTRDCASWRGASVSAPVFMCVCRMAWRKVFAFAYAYLRWIIAFTGFESAYIYLWIKNTRIRVHIQHLHFCTLNHPPHSWCAPCIFHQQFPTGWQNHYNIFAIKICYLWQAHFLWCQSITNSSIHTTFALYFYK